MSYTNSNPSPAKPATQIPMTDSRPLPAVDADAVTGVFVLYCPCVMTGLTLTLTLEKLDAAAVGPTAVIKVVVFQLGSITGGIAGANVAAAGATEIDEAATGSADDVATAGSDAGVAMAGSAEDVTGSTGSVADATGAGEGVGVTVAYLATGTSSVSVVVARMTVVIVLSAGSYQMVVTASPVAVSRLPSEHVKVVV
jgi:hypothetical protein